MKALLIAIALVAFLISPILAVFWVERADARLTRAAEQPEEQSAVAAAANEDYCTPDLRRILRRVVQSCGLLGEGGGGRGCQPLQAKQVATMGGSDFNALFIPMQQRGGIVQFAKDSADLDLEAHKLIEQVFADQRGASYFFVVSRSSPEGALEHNRQLSRDRAQAVMSYLEQNFDDEDLKRQVGLLWLGEEYAQLDDSFCQWTRSGVDATCTQTDLNRSAFLAWVDCEL